MQRRLNILVANPHIPKPDRSSGDRRLAALLTLLAEHHEVDLHAPQVWDTPEVAQHYLTQLRGAGINVFTDCWRALDSALAHRRYDVVIIEFWNYAEQICEAVKRWQPQAKIIVDSVDVHFVREEAGLALGLSDAANVESRKQDELACYRSADAVIVVTAEDREALSAGGLSRLYVVPNIVPSRARPPGQRGPELLFIAGFAHTPNIDGICWFVREAWPQVRAAVPGATLCIVGSDPTPQVLALAGEPGVRVHGYVPDTGPHLDRAAVSIAPLRYGGGMKGKVTEALAAGIPVVATAVGAQGFGAASGRHLIIADTAPQFAEGVINLLSNPALAETIGKAGAELVETICSPQAVAQQVNQMLAEISPTRTWNMKSSLAWYAKSAWFRLKTMTRAAAHKFGVKKSRGIPLTDTSSSTARPLPPSPLYSRERGPDVPQKA